MRRNRTILIWTGILTFLATVLILAACETGALDIPDEQGDVMPEQTQPDNTAEDTGKDTTGQVPADVDSPSAPIVEEPDTLTVGKPYSAKLVEEGSKNILIIGEDKMNSLYDTIGIASIDSKNKKVSLIMIPRDTYIEYNSVIKAKLDEAKVLHSPGVFKINYTHHVGGRIGYKGKFNSGSISFLADVIEEKFNVRVQDYVKINTKGFVELIDHLGGIDVYVPYRMDYIDPTQDLVIDIPEGTQHLDGHDAEGFVRFRQGYKEDGTLFEIGDTGRKKNQLYFLQQLIKQKGTVGNIGKIPGIIDILGRNVQHSVGIGDVLSTYMGLATKVITEDYEITSLNLSSDKMIRIDGASYLVLE